MWSLLSQRKDPLRMCMSIQLWARARFAFLPSNRRAAIHHWWTQWASTSLYRELSCSYISWSHRGPLRRSHYNGQNIIGIRFSRVWPPGRFSSSYSPTRVPSDGMKIKKFFYDKYSFIWTHLRKTGKNVIFHYDMCIWWVLICIAEGR